MAYSKKRLRHLHQHEGIKGIDYYAYTSGLKDWNAMVKVVFAFLVLIICIGMNHLYVSVLVTVSMAYFTIFAGRLKAYGYFTFLKIPLAFMLLGSLPIAVEISNHSMAGYSIKLLNFYVSLSMESVWRAFEVTMKALGAVSAMYMLILSTPVGEIINVLYRLHMPQLLVDLMHMIYRFIFILLDVQQKMKQSAQSRLGYIDFKTSLYSFGNTASNLLVISLKKANAYYDAMESRCYTGQLLFWEEEKKVKKRQIIGIGLYLGILVWIGMRY